MSEMYSGLAEAVIEGKIKDIKHLTETALSGGSGPQQVLEEGLLPGMDEVGKRFKVGDMFSLFTFSAARALDSLAIKKYFHEKDRRFATREELMVMTGLESGTVPPFGKPILPFDHFLDNSILQNDEIAFNAGSITDSIIMKVADYQKTVQTTVFYFTKEPDN